MSQSMGGLVATTEEQYKKLNLPAWPDSVRELFVSFAPWFALLVGLLGLLTFIPGLIALLTLSAVAGAFGAGIGWVLGIISLILNAAGAVTALMAFSGLRKHTLAGWSMLFMTACLFFLSGVVQLSIGAIIGAIIA
jgi:hypothetical protein